jgi:uncharacterized membrane protein YozB (DUF420 family)
MWAVIAAMVVYHEFACDEGELLSEAVDRGLQKSPVLIYSFVAVTVAHLLNWLPEKYDPYSGFGIHLLSKLKGASV